LWILRTKFRFISTQKLKLSSLTSVRNTLHVLRQLQFRTIISIHSKCAVYDHVVVVWQGWVLDYESEVIYMLTEELLHQLCGVNSTFSHISCGYGLFPPKGIWAMSPEVTDWGDSSFYSKNLPIRKFYYIYLLILFPKKQLQFPFGKTTKYLFKLSPSSGITHNG
jgi:hypothetical protein